MNIADFAQGLGQSVIGGGETFIGCDYEDWTRGNGGREIIEVQFLGMIMDFAGQRFPTGSREGHKIVVTLEILCLILDCGRVRAQVAA